MLTPYYPFQPGDKVAADSPVGQSGAETRHRGRPAGNPPSPRLLGHRYYSQREHTGVRGRLGPRAASPTTSSRSGDSRPSVTPSNVATVFKRRVAAEPHRPAFGSRAPCLTQPSTALGTARNETTIPLLSCGFLTHRARLSQPLYTYLRLEVNAKHARR